MINLPNLSDILPKISSLNLHIEHFIVVCWVSGLTADTEITCKYNLHKNTDILKNFKQESWD